MARSGEAFGLVQLTLPGACDNGLRFALELSDSLIRLRSVAASFLADSAVVTGYRPVISSSAKDPAASGLIVTASGVKKMLGLVQQLIEGTGVSASQAEGGAGLLFGLVKERLASGDFARVADALPGVEGLIDGAPESGGGLGGLLSGVASALGGQEAGGLASLASGFSKLDLDAGMIGKFIPIVLNYLQSSGGSDLASLVKGVLQSD
jgi:hypothetical protein